MHIGGKVCLMFKAVVNFSSVNFSRNHLDKVLQGKKMQINQVAFFPVIQVEDKITPL